MKPAAAPDAAESEDEAFDRIYPDDIRGLSEVHFTPVAVARYAAGWLGAHPHARVLDVGAGVGKFCLVGALTTGATFHGVEQRGHFVDIARRAARTLGATRAHFLHANLLDGDWSGFTGFYLFNPFAEHVAARGIDDLIDRSPGQHRRYVAFTQDMLAAAPTGARVVTYHGFGGPMPASYRHVHREIRGADVLECWVKLGPERVVPDASGREPWSGATHA